MPDETKPTTARRRHEAPTTAETAPDTTPVTPTSDDPTPPPAPARTDPEVVDAQIAPEPAEPAEVAEGGATKVSYDDPDALEALAGASAQGSGFVRIDRDVVREFYFPKTTRPSYELLYHAGQLVSQAALTARAASLRAALADRTRLENYIDGSTYASGTGLVAEQAAQGSTSPGVTTDSPAS
jgi:hypothetical protein